MMPDASPLRRARLAATAVLALATAVFLSTFALGDAAWVGFVRAAAEAGMIGGLADWFAVTALFRHPLGIPIPHTAIIPRSKDALGKNLASFVADNFLDPVVVKQRLEEADLPNRLGTWLADEDGSRVAARHVATVLGAVAEGTASDQVWADLESVLLDRVQRMPISELGGRTLRRSVESGELAPLVTGAIRAIDTSLTDNADYLRRRIADESPWWVPESIDAAVFEKAMELARVFLAEVVDDADHAVRRMIDTRLLELAERMQSDPLLQAEIAERITGLTQRVEFRTWLRSAWTHAVESVAGQSDQISSALRTLGSRLTEDKRLQERIDVWLDGMTEPVTVAARIELQTLIPATISRWDPEDTAQRLEQWMGRDLQFVRINGTLVGALIGLVLHTSVLLLD